MDTIIRYLTGMYQRNKRLVDNERERRNLLHPMYLRTYVCKGLGYSHVCRSTIARIGDKDEHRILILVRYP